PTPWSCRAPTAASAGPWSASASATSPIWTTGCARHAACSGRGAGSWCWSSPRPASRRCARSTSSISVGCSPQSAARCRNIGKPTPTCQSRWPRSPRPRRSPSGSSPRGSGTSATSCARAGSAPSTMALDNLRQFIAAIDAGGDLTRVEHSVSVDKEITEIADRCMKSPGGGPALLFTRPTLPGGAPSQLPVAVNLFGSEKRMALALGVACLDDIGARIAELLNLKVPDSLLGKLAMLPRTIDEYLFAGFLRGEPVRLAKAVTSDLEVPAEAEVVIEGFVDPREELVLEGPFGDHTGFYSLADYYPKVHVTAITMREDPLWPHTIVGRPPMEDYYLGHATERIFLPLLK